MTQSLISVIIPAYNHASLITEAICSVTDQDYPSLELILIDDGSSDDTADRAEDTLKRQKIPFQIVRQPNQGAHTAINNGIALARGEWITILNSDDRFSPFRIVRLLDHASRAKSRFVFSRVHYMNQAGFPLPPSAPQNYYYERALESKDLYPSPNFEFLRHNYAITTGNFFLHHSLTDQIGGFRDLKICHDWDFVLRALLVEEISFLDEKLYEYRVHPDNTIRPAVNDLRYQEIDMILSNYLRQAETASNPLAPSYKNWGLYWKLFVRSQIIFGYLHETASAIKEITENSTLRRGETLDRIHYDLLAKALDVSQRKNILFDEKLTNVQTNLERLANKSLRTILWEKLKKRLAAHRK